jgi:hypothetical protein
MQDKGISPANCTKKWISVKAMNEHQSQASPTDGDEIRNQASSSEGVSHSMM